MLRAMPSGSQTILQARSPSRVTQSGMVTTEALDQDASTLFGSNNSISRRELIVPVVGGGSSYWAEAVGEGDIGRGGNSSDT